MVMLLTTIDNKVKNILISGQFKNFLEAVKNVFSEQFQDDGVIPAYSQRCPWHDDTKLHLLVNL